MQREFAQMEDGATADAQIFTDQNCVSARPEKPSDGPYLYRSLTGQVIGAFYEVYNALRWGLPESAYAGALDIELRDRGISFRREARLDVWYKERIAGCYRADFHVEGCLILELKVASVIGDCERRQLLNYLRITNTRLGLLLHFGAEAKVVRLING